MTTEKPDKEEESIEEIGARLIKTLRYKAALDGFKTKTHLSNKECEHALITAKGNVDKALEVLQKNGVFQQPIQKQYYTVELTGQAPVTLTYRILADDEEQALQEVERNITSIPFSKPPKVLFAQFRKKQGRVFKFGTTLIDYIRNF